ncbi:unnamed protein product [Amoebophrya sp. A120]|nr:unnamed protein product [Amoebophrya sp. A120]|eukprot:GSA120T00011674001.1
MFASRFTRHMRLRIAFQFLIFCTATSSGFYSSASARKIRLLSSERRQTSSTRTIPMAAADVATFSSKQQLAERVFAEVKKLPEYGNPMLLLDKDASALEVEARLGRIAGNDDYSREQVEKARASLKADRGVVHKESDYKYRIMGGYSQDWVRYRFDPDIDVNAYRSIQISAETSLEAQREQLKLQALESQPEEVAPAGENKGTAPRGGADAAQEPQQAAFSSSSSSSSSSLAVSTTPSAAELAKRIATATPFLPHKWVISQEDRTYFMPSDAGPRQDNSTKGGGKQEGKGKKGKNKDGRRIRAVRTLSKFTDDGRDHMGSVPELKIEGWKQDGNADEGEDGQALSLRKDTIGQPDQSIDLKQALRLEEKSRIIDIDVITGGEFDLRISISREKNLDSERPAFDKYLETQPKPIVTRKKRRHSYWLGSGGFIGSLDMTEVKQFGGGKGGKRKETSEVELELDTKELQHRLTTDAKSLEPLLMGMISFASTLATSDLSEKNKILFTGAGKRTAEERERSTLLAKDTATLYNPDEFSAPAVEQDVHDADRDVENLPRKKMKPE